MHSPTTDDEREVLGTQTPPFGGSKARRAGIRGRAWGSVVAMNERVVPALEV